MSARKTLPVFNAPLLSRPLLLLPSFQSLRRGDCCPLECLPRLSRKLASFRARESRDGSLNQCGWFGKGKRVEVVLLEVGERVATDGRKESQLECLATAGCRGKGNALDESVGALVCADVFQDVKHRRVLLQTPVRDGDLGRRSAGRSTGRSATEPIKEACETRRGRTHACSHSGKCPALTSSMQRV